MIEKRRSSSYQLPPLKYPQGIERKGRRRSTSEINKRRSVDVEVRPIQEEINLFSGLCGGITQTNNEIHFLLTREHEALEKRLLKEAAAVIATHRGSFISLFRLVFLINLFFYLIN